MSQLALYRKYRPETFEDVVGQEHIVKVLQASLASGKVSHAYLLTGSRGTGKTTVARLIAKALGTSANDIYEMDAASNRGIDDIRELRENVRTLPFDSKYKVYIIDEVHMLTKEAFNALLKTLEEPPAHVIFVLATTELEKVPDTIISRCQTFTFKKPSETLLATVVASTAKREGVTLEAGASELIALLGEGSFRDTLSILQKVLTQKENGSTITRSQVEELTGAPTMEFIKELLQALSDKSLANGLASIERASAQNADMRIVLKLVIVYLRYILLLRYAPEMKDIIRERVGETELQFLKELLKTKSDALSSKTLARLLDAYQAMRVAFIPEVPLELALIDILGQNGKA
jgi:DNA polymerase-3 subunit gamma/tau